MNKSESIKELATALAQAQGDITNTAKNTKNPHYGKNYADLGAILDTVRPVFAEYGLSVMQMPSFNAGLVSVETLVMHKSGEWVSSCISAPVSKQDAQGVGSATTYCRRYALAAMAGIAQTDDDAESAIGRAPAGAARPAAKPKPAPAAAPAQQYSAEQFTKNMPEWHKRVAAGTALPADIVAGINHKGYLLSDAQLEQIYALKTEAAA